MNDATPTINLSSLLRSPGETSIQGEMTELRYEQGGEEQVMRFAEPAPFKISVNTIGGNDFWLSGTFRPTLQLECARCLREVPASQSLKLGALLRYDPSVEAPHLSEAASGEEVLLFGEPNLDLSNFLAEATLVDAPLSVLHDPDCKGLCQECGHDLNEGDCAHHAHVPRVDEARPGKSPFAALQGLQLPDE